MLNFLVERIVIKTHENDKEPWIRTTSTTQSRSIATPNATPHNLSIAPANTSTINQGRRRTDDEVGSAVWA